MPPNSTTNETRKTIEALSARLRLVQSSFAEVSPNRRMEHVRDEIERVLGAISPPERRGFLEELTRRFPAWQDASAPVPEMTKTVVPKAAPEPVAAAAVAQSIDVSLDVLLKAMKDAIPNLDEDERLEICRAMVDSGLPVSFCSDSELAELRQALHLPPEHTVQLDRILRLVIMLADFVNKLDQPIWSTWRQIAPNANFRRQVDLRQAMGEYANGDDRNFPKSIVALRRLILALVSSIAKAPRYYATVQIKKISPAEIEAICKSEGRAFMGSWETKYWRKYAELTANMTAETIEKEIVDAVYLAAEEIMAGLRR